jgi:hypothetical protein
VALDPQFSASSLMVPELAHYCCCAGHGNNEEPTKFHFPIFSLFFIANLMPEMRILVNLSGAGFIHGDFLLEVILSNGL